MISRVALLAVPLILLVGGIVSLSTRTTDPSNDGLSLNEDVGNALVTLGSIFLIFSLMIVSVSNANAARERAVKQIEQTAVVFTIAKNDELLIGVSQTIGHKVGAVRRKTPGACMAVSGNADGLGVWSGRREPVKVLALAWDEVVGMQVGLLDGMSSSTGGMTVEVQKDGREALLPLVVLGHGFGGVFPAPKDERNQLIVRLRELKALHRRNKTD